MTIATYIVAAIFALGGILALYAAITDARWFFDTRSARSVTSAMSHATARLTYGLLGVAILAMAVYIALTA